MNNTTTTNIHYIGGCKDSHKKNSVSSLIQITCDNCIRIIEAQLNKDTPNSSNLGGGKDFAKDQKRKIPECRIYGVKAKSSSVLIKTATQHVLNGHLKEIILLYRETVFSDLPKLNQAITSVEDLINEQFQVNIKMKYRLVGDRAGFKLNSDVNIKYMPTLAVFVWKLVNIAYFDFLSLHKFNQMLRNQSNPSQRAYRSVLFALYTGDFTRFDFNDLFDQKKGSDAWQLKSCGAYYRSVKKCTCGASVCSFALNKPSLNGTTRYVKEAILIGWEVTTVSI